MSPEAQRIKIKFYENGKLSEAETELTLDTLKLSYDKYLELREKANFNSYAEIDPMSVKLVDGKKEFGFKTFNMAAFTKAKINAEVEAASIVWGLTELGKTVKDVPAQYFKAMLDAIQKIDLLELQRDEDEAKKKVTDQAVGA